MGMVPIPVISPLTLTRSDEPMLDPPLPISRVENSAGNTDRDADESYSPREQDPAPDPTPQDAEGQTSVSDSALIHPISFFA